MNSQTEQELFGYKIGIGFTILMQVIFAASILGLINDTIKAVTENTFGMTNIITIVAASVVIGLLIYLMYKVRTMCKKQIKNILKNGIQIWVKVLHIEKITTKSSTNARYSMKYTCEDSVVIEVPLPFMDKDHIKVGTIIKVTKWNDNHRTYYAYEDYKRE